MSNQVADAAGQRERIDAYLERSDLARQSPRVVPLTGDASDRRYYRVLLPDAPSIVLSLYAGGHAQRRVDPSWNADGCEQDEEEAQDSLVQYGWSDREDEFRARSAALVDKHWTEIAAVARDLLVYEALNADEVMQIADAAAGDPDANVEEYRLIWRDHLEAFRRRMLAGQER
jgi:hypothetical protein